MKIVVGLLAASMAFAGSDPKVPNSSTGGAQVVITARPASSGGDVTLQAEDVTVLAHNVRVPVTRLERLSGNMADMQLFVLLDDSTRSSSLGTQLPELKSFVASLPPSTQVAIGYMRNGSFTLAQQFTSDHQKAATALRLPMAMPGGNGSPYFALSSLVDHWPSHQTTGRRAILMLTDGVDRYYTNSILDDPYVDAAIHKALKSGIPVYSIYLRGAGLYGRGGWGTDIAQSRLIQVSEETGGHAYFEGVSDPVTISPFLIDLGNRFEHQYRVTLGASNEKGLEALKYRTEVQGVKVEGPSRIYLQ